MPASSALSRKSQREGTVGTPSIFSARVRITSGDASSVAKSWADWPILSSGDGSPSVFRMGRLSQGPGSADSGHVPSFKEPRMTTSVCCRRASNGPQMKTRGWTGTRGRTVSPAIRLR